MHPILQKDFQEIFASDLPWYQLKNKRIFCTGGTGFLFRYFIQFLCWLNQQMELGISLELYCRKSSVKIAPVDLCGTSVHWLEGNITQISDEMSHPDIIIHAASPANQQSWKNTPRVQLVETNILATKTFLEKACETHATVLYVSSSEVYPNSTQKIIETQIDAQSVPRSFYGACKLAGESLCDQYRQEYGLFCPVIRPVSIYGPGESLDSGRHFTQFLKQTLQGEPVTLTGTGMQQRSYCYLSDFVKGVLYVLLCGDNTAYNIGNEQNACSIFQMAQLISRMGANQGVIAPNHNASASCMDTYILDTNKLRTLGWKPTVNLEECVKRTMQSYQQGEKAYDSCRIYF